MSIELDEIDQLAAETGAAEIAAWKAALREHDRIGKQAVDQWWQRVCRERHKAEVPA